MLGIATFGWLIFFTALTANIDVTTMIPKPNSCDDAHLCRRLSHLNDWLVNLGEGFGCCEGEVAIRRLRVIDGQKELQLIVIVLDED